MSGGGCCARISPNHAVLGASVAAFAAVTLMTGERPLFSSSSASSARCLHGLLSNAVARDDKGFILTGAGVDAQHLLKTDSLARHFADWGAASRFAIGGETPIRTTDSAQPLDTDQLLRCAVSRAL